MSAKSSKIATDKDRYVSGESIRISGVAESMPPEKPINIQIYDPNNQPHRCETVKVKPDGAYSFDFKLLGKNEVSGTYKIVATSGSRKIDTSFIYESKQFGDKVIIIPLGTGNEENGKSFEPFSIDIQPSSTVTWINQDTTSHTTTSGNPETGKSDGAFNSGFIPPGGSSTLQIGKSDRILDYFCSLHPWEKGVINPTGNKDTRKSLSEYVPISDRVSAYVIRAGDSEIIQNHKKLAKLERHFSESKVALLDYSDLTKPKKRLLTIVFWDIHKFTQLSQILSEIPELLIEFLQKYYSKSTEVIYKHDGSLDKTMGDGILGLFSIPNKDDSGTADAISAINAAIELREVFENLTREWTKIWKGYIEKNVSIDISLRCGINKGYVIYGNIGSDKSDQLTAIGMRVNIANRLESEASPNKIVISATTKEELTATLNVIHWEFFLI